MANVRITVQYDSLPYPPRNPADDRVRLLPTMLDALPALNHHCFGGKRDFRKNFRVLVAGGGTGDATVYLADQLRDTDARIVHCDVSRGAMRIAQERAAARRLERKIEWVLSDLRELLSKGFGPFDYINCSGVLHHLEDPIDGLRALASLLAPGGAVGIMVYGLYGRTGVYQAQALLRLLNHDVPDIATQLENAKAVLASLPPSNWFRRGAEMFPGNEDLTTDAGIYDLLLHSTDRAFTVPELYSGLGHAGLHLVDFAPDYRALYDPMRVIRLPKMARSVAKLSLPRQQALAELYWGSIAKHVFWAAGEPARAASWFELDNVPFFFGPVAVDPAEVRTAVQAVRAGQACLIRIDRPDSPAIVVEFPMTEAAERFLALIDGSRTIGDIMEATLLTFDEANRQEALSAVYAATRALGSCDLLLLRHRTVDPIHMTAGEA